MTLPFARLPKEGERGMEWPKSENSIRYYAIISGPHSNNRDANRKRLQRFGFFLPLSKESITKKASENWLSIWEARGLVSNRKARNARNARKRKRLLKLTPP